MPADTIDTRRVEERRLKVELDAALDVFGPRVKEAVLQELEESGYSFEENGNLGRLRGFLVRIGGESLASIVMKRLTKQISENNHARKR